MTSLQSTPKVTSPHLCPADLAKGSQGCSWPEPRCRTMQQENNFPDSGCSTCQEARRDSVRGCGHHIRVQPLSGIPVSSLLTGCWAPPCFFPAPVGGAELPVRHFLRTGRGREGLLEVLGTVRARGSAELKVIEPCGPFGKRAAMSSRSKRCARTARRSLWGVFWPDPKDLFRCAVPGLELLTGNLKSRLGFFLVLEFPRGNALVRGCLHSPV